MTTGEKIIKLRKERGLSQEQLAEALNISRQSLSKWESDVCLPDTFNLIALSEFFDISTDYLLKDIEENKDVKMSTFDIIKNKINKRLIYTFLYHFAVLYIFNRFCSLLLFKVDSSSGVSITYSLYAFIFLPSYGGLNLIGLAFYLAFYISIIFGFVHMITQNAKHVKIKKVFNIISLIFSSIFVLSVLSYGITTLLFIVLQIADLILYKKVVTALY